MIDPLIVLPVSRPAALEMSTALARRAYGRLGEAASGGRHSRLDIGPTPTRKDEAMTSGGYWMAKITSSVTESVRSPAEICKPGAAGAGVAVRAGVGAVAGAA